MYVLRKTPWTGSEHWQGGLGNVVSGWAAASQEHYHTAVRQQLSWPNLERLQPHRGELCSWFHKGCHWTAGPWLSAPSAPRLAGTVLLMEMDSRSAWGYVGTGGKQSRTWVAGQMTLLDMWGRRAGMATVLAKAEPQGGRAKPPDPHLCSAHPCPLDMVCPASLHSRKGHSWWNGQRK